MATVWIVHDGPEPQDRLVQALEARGFGAHVVDRRALPGSAGSAGADLVIVVSPAAVQSDDPAFARVPVILLRPSSPEHEAAGHGAINADLVLPVPCDEGVVASCAQGVLFSRRRHDNHSTVTKMEAVGRFASGVGHDLNNMLMVIRGFVDILARQVPAEDPQARYLAEIRGAGDRAADLARQLLLLSPRYVVAEEDLDLNEVAARAADTALRSLGDAARVELDAAPGRLPIRGDRDHLERAITDIVLNARDTTRPGGRISLETRIHEVAGMDYEAMPAMPPGPYAAVTVRDTGGGMSSDDAAHLFEPYFTTVERGRGKGLGLAAVYAVVRHHRGYVRLATAAGVGTALGLYFPRADDREKTRPG